MYGEQRMNFMEEADGLLEDMAYASVEPTPQEVDKAKIQLRKAFDENIQVYEKRVGCISATLTEYKIGSKGEIEAKIHVRGTEANQTGLFRMRGQEILLVNPQAELLFKAAQVQPDPEAEPVGENDDLPAVDPGDEQPEEEKEGDELPPDPEEDNP
jgi:hypothetical protein